jgi:hypothetical protein
MSVIMRFAALSFLASGLSFAGSWRGALVDSRCFESEEHNVNPGDTLANVDRDRNWEIRFCAPRVKSKSFALVDRDGRSFQLDPEGNRKAAELVRKTGKKDLFLVVVNGEKSGHKLMVDSIAASD